MYRGIEILITELKNSASMYAYVKDRIYQEDIATLGDPAFPCMTVHVDSQDIPTGAPKRHKAEITLTIFSSVSYEECEKIFSLLIGEDAFTTLPLLHLRAYTNTNNNYTAYFKFARGGARVAAPLEEGGQSIIYSLSSGWLMFGYY